MAHGWTGDEEQGEFGASLRVARSREAAHYDAAGAFRDAKALRLQVLKDELGRILAGSPEARETFDLAISPGDPPRLWIDLITSVVMEPDPRTYRLVQDVQGGRETRFETEDRAELLEHIKLFMAHGVIARQRARSAHAMARPPSLSGYSAAALILAWSAGFALGVLALLSGAIYLKILRF